MLGLINWRLKVTINDGRAFVGQMLAFDKHMNLVLADCEEFRHVRPKKKAGESESAPEQEMKRSLGLVILRGETVVSLSVEGPPPVQDEDKKNAVCAILLFTERSPSQSFLFSSFLLALVAGCQLGVEWEWCPPVRVVFLPYEFSIGSDCHLLLHLHALTAGPPAFARPPMPFAPPGMPGAPPGFRPPGFPPGVPFPPPPGFGGPPPG
jgi:small nuclear ribonucleoprotein B and B'